MKDGASVPLLVSLILFLIFFGNVLAGSMDWGEIFGKVVQVIVLLVACIFFVIGTLMKESQEKSSKT